MRKPEPTYQANNATQSCQ